jgi:hypothetical protein
MRQREVDEVHLVRHLADDLIAVASTLPLPDATAVHVDVRTLAEALTEVV